MYKSDFIVRQICEKYLERVRRVFCIFGSGESV